MATDPSDDAIEPAIRAAYDPEAFRALGHEVIDQLSDAMIRWQARAGAVMPRLDLESLMAIFDARTAAASAPSPMHAWLPFVLDASTALAHPRYIGHQVAPPLPAASLLELVSAVLNNGMAIAEMGPASTAMEHTTVAWLASCLGLPAAAGGVLTSGGSIGNLTALLAARAAAASTGGRDVWKDGIADAQRLTIVVSDQLHYSITRAASIMGLGEQGVVLVPTDAKYRMRPAAAAAAIATARAEGRTVIALVAAAGSTSTGAFDPLDELADVARAAGVWLHVDGAHGASMALSRTHRHLVAGIERADSVVWDAHKMMMLPALITAVLFADGQRSHDAFAQEASYLYAGKGTGARPRFGDIGPRTIECTKRMMSLEVFGTLRHHGALIWEQLIDRLMGLGGELARRIAAHPELELAIEPAGNIVCFRHVVPGAGGAALDAHQQAIRARIVASGRFYLVMTTLRTGVHLRTAIMNPLTEIQDLEALIAEVISVGRSII